MSFSVYLHPEIFLIELWEEYLLPRSFVLRIIHVQLPEGVLLALLSRIVHMRHPELTNRNAQNVVSAPIPAWPFAVTAASSPVAA